MYRIYRSGLLICLLCAIISLGCSKEEDQEGVLNDDNQNISEEPSDQNNSSQENEAGVNCDPSDFIFEETGGLIHAEFENSGISDDWELSSTTDGFSGEGYVVWTGNQYLGNPGNGIISFKIKINSPGTYQFLWYSAVTEGNEGTEHNDSWLRFPDADDFFGQKGNSIVYPKGTGKTPNPNGASVDGWFKIYRSGNDMSFKWQALTSDHDGHDIYVNFENPGTYTMEVSARSSGHAIDQFVLFKDITRDQATMSNDFSIINCLD